MNIPENGRVVIIDDKFEEEGLPLIKALTKINVPTLYFTGNLEELPRGPLKGVRIIFLDIVLGTDGQPPKTQVSTAAHVMKKIIDITNGPYLLVAWTKHEEHLGNIKDALKDRPPICVLDLEKSSCKNKNGSFSIAKIEKKIKSELRKVASFHIFVLWENLLHKAAGEVVNDFSGFYQKDSQWDEKMSTVFFQLAKAYTGKNIEMMKNKDIVKDALLAFNGVFIDTLENKIKNDRMDHLNVITHGSISPAIRANINKKLLLFFNNPIVKPEPGNIYEVTTKLGVKLDLNEIFNENKLSSYPQKDDLISKIKYILLESSPSCDFAQNNLRVHRCLVGVMWPYEHENKIKKGDFIYTTTVLEANGNLYRFVFNLRYLISIPIQKLKNRKALCRFRHDLLVDVQAHIARHINRPGIISV